MKPPAISAVTLVLFRRIVRGYFRRHFHAVRLSGAERLRGADGPLIVYANHGSWWDPMVSMLLADKLMRQRRHYAPMDAEALERYPILKRVGIFPVEMASARGAVQFLRTSEAVLAEGGVLWVTPQGRFVDARVRPLEFKPGLAALAHRAGECVVLPLAIEYPFWDERTPEVLLHFGDAVRVSAGESVEAIQARLVAALETTMDELRAMAVLRSGAGFRLLAGGTVGVGGLYGLGQRVKALVQGRAYRAEHTAGVDGEAR